jgi:alpha-glucosidase/alpha-D-xyloside xylohydrolase
VQDRGRAIFVKESFMSGRFTRRQALKRIGTAGAGLILTRGLIRGRTGDIVVAGQPVEIAVSALSPVTVRLTVLPIAGGATRDLLLDGAVGPEGEGRPLSRRREPERFEPVPAGDLTVRFTADPPTLHVETMGGRAAQRFVLDAAGPGLSFLLGRGPLLGLGQGGPQYDRKGTTDAMRSGQAGYRLATHGGRVPIQWLVGTDGWAIFIHHPLGAFDFSGAEGRFAPTGDGLPLDLYVVASPDPTVIMREYARITGRAEMPPRWSLGYMQSHRTLAGPDEVRDVARTMREKKLPCDALIYLGTDFTPSGWNTHNGEFAWNAGNFPDPKGMIEELHRRHYKVVLHIVIEGRRLNGAVKDPCDPKDTGPSGRTPDNRWPDDRSVPCYWPYHKPLVVAGVDGWWPDQGDDYDPPSRLNRNRMYWEGPQLWRPDERPFALHRNGYAGMQRYAAFLWSGDVQSRWETLRTHVPVAVNAGLSGIPYWGTDIGGFIPTPEYTGELHIRWFQFGAFCPLFRAHGRHWHLRLPWGWDGGDGGPKETNAFNADPQELRNSRVEPILRKYLELRYRLLPYIYSAVREGCETGLPIVRALWLHYPDDPVATARGDQYLWGRDVLVSPVVEKGATARRLYLPRGSWFDFWTEERLEGGREIERPVDLETMPLHVRAGAILPLGPVRQYVDEPVEGPLTLVIYPGADGAFSLYEDDGRTFAYRKGDWMRIDMGWKNAEHILTLDVAPGSRLRTPAERTIEVRLAGQKTSRRLVFDGRPQKIRI